MDMVRPRKAAAASRKNGALASNKGKAKMKAPVLEHGFNQRAGVFEVTTVERAKLPKGYVAYESELATLRMSFFHGRSDSKKDEDNTKSRTRVEAMEDAKAQSMKLAVDAKDWDVAQKMAEIKKVTAGAERPFVFKETTKSRPHRGSARSARSR